MVREAVEVVDLKQSIPGLVYFTGSTLYTAAAFAPDIGAVLLTSNPEAMPHRAPEKHRLRIEMVYKELAKSADIGLLLIRSGGSKAACVRAIERFRGNT